MTFPSSVAMFSQFQLTDILIRFRTQMIGIAHDAAEGAIPACTSTTTGVADRLLLAVRALDTEIGRDITGLRHPHDRPHHP